MTAELYRQHSPAMRAIIGAIVGDALDVQDVLHDAWVKFYTSDFRGQCSTRLWLEWIARSVALQAMKSVCRRRHLGEMYLNPREQAHPDVRLSTRSELEGVRAAITSLPAQDKTYLVLSAVEGIEPARIAELLKVSRVVVNKRIHGARKKLRARAS